MAKRKKHVPVEDIEIQMWTVHTPVLQWTGSLTKYVDGVAQFRIEATDWSPTRLLAVLDSAGWQAEQGERDHNLILPNMGDWTIQYFSTK